MSQTPAENLAAMNLALANGGTFALPSGDFRVAGPPRLTSKCTIVAHDSGSLALINTLGGPAINSVAPGLGYTQVDHVSNPLKVGDKVCWFRYDGQYAADGLGVMSQWSKVVTLKNQNTYTTDPPKRPQHTAVFRTAKAWYCEAAAKGAESVALREPATGLAAGMSVLVTPGPTVANAASGEQRTVTTIEGQRVYLDEPLHYEYPPCVVAWTDPVEDVSILGVELIAQPNGNPVTWGSQFKGHRRLVLKDYTCAGATDLVTCEGSTIWNGRVGPVQFNTSQHCTIVGSRLTAFYAEEVCDRLSVLNCRIGPAVKANCVAAWFHVDRLRFRDVEVFGAGDLVNGWPAAAFSCGGNGNTFDNIRVAESVGGWSVFSGDDCRVTGFDTDGAFQAKGRRVSLSGLRGPYSELLDCAPPDENFVYDARNAKVGEGWHVGAPVTYWFPMTGAAPKMPPPAGDQLVSPMMGLRAAP